MGSIPRSVVLEADVTPSLIQAGAGHGIGDHDHLLILARSLSGGLEARVAGTVPLAQAATA